MHKNKSRDAAVIAGIDHFVLTVRSVDDTCDFYQRVLGFKRLDEPDRPTALLFGTQKINVHEVGHTFEPKAKAPTQGSGDFCLIAVRLRRRPAKAALREHGTGSRGRGVTC